QQFLAVRWLRLTCLWTAEYKLNVALPIDAHGLLQIKPRHWEHLLLPVASQNVKHLRLDPLVLRQVATSALENQQGGLRAVLVKVTTKDLSLVVRDHNITCRRTYCEVASRHQARGGHDSQATWL